MLRQIALWIDDRLHLSKLFDSTAGHTVPANAGSWFYVFGSGTLTCFMLQIVTGICLAFVYVPSADEALHDSGISELSAAPRLVSPRAAFLGFQLHGQYHGHTHDTGIPVWGFQVSRELTWISGCVLLLLTLGMAFTGQIMRFDQDAYWGLGIGAAIMGRVPLIGPNLVHLLLGGPIIAGETLSRFFTLHVFVIPGLLIALISLHLRLVLAKGINEYPVPGQEVKRESYAEEYEALLKKEGVPFYPKAIDKDLVFSGLVMLGILACAAYFGPKGPEGYRTRLTSIRCRRRISFSSGFMPRWHCCRRTWRLFFCSPRRWLALGSSSRCLLFPTPEKKVPGAGRWPCWA